MRLLVPTRTWLAVRTATVRPVQRDAVETRARKLRSTPTPAAAPPTKTQLLLRLWELSKVGPGAIDSIMKKKVDRVRNGEDGIIKNDNVSFFVRILSNINDFESMANLLEQHKRCMQNRKTVPDAILVIDVLWAAANAKSLGALPPSILEWIEEAVHRLPEPMPVKKNQIIWLLSIVRGDLPMLQQLQQESCSRIEGVGPVIEREKTLRYAALAYLHAGKEEEFRSLWTSSDSPIMGRDDNYLGPEYDMSTTAMMHHALLRRANSGKPDPAMLRWYAESLAVHQRTPISEKPEFKTMMVPMIKDLGGRIEKWKEDDWRKKKLQKWKDDYGLSEMDNLTKMILDYMKHLIEVEKIGNAEDLRRMMVLLDQLESDDEYRGMVVIEWLNFMREKHNRLRDLHLLGSHSLIVVGREPNWKISLSGKIRGGFFAHMSPKEKSRFKEVNVTQVLESKKDIYYLCPMFLAVATRGHLLTNDKMNEEVAGFQEYLQNKSWDISPSILLRNYLNDAVLRHVHYRIQPVEDHSRAAQWIDKEKKELAFTVARKLDDYIDLRISSSGHLFRTIDHYSLHIE